MNIRNLFVSFFLIINTNTFSEVSYRKIPKLFNPWLTDSLFVGADIIANDSLLPIKIKVKKSLNAAEGELYFINPNTDSALYISNNKHIDSSEIEIGQFADGTTLTFMFIVTDTMSLYNKYRGKKLYTGQNRIGIDKYISERSLEKGGFGARWAVVGNIDSSKLEVGFEEKSDYAFRGIIFEVTNAKLQK